MKHRTARQRHLFTEIREYKLVSGGRGQGQRYKRLAQKVERMRVRRKYRRWNDD